MSFTDPAAVEAAFYAAFQALDIKRMREVWLESADASCIHPGGALLRGTDAILTSWAEIFRKSQPPRLVHRTIQASADNRLAVHTVEENITSGAGERQAVVLATNVYQLVNGGWQMLAHHASLPLVESRAEKADPTPLH